MIAISTRYKTNGSTNSESRLTCKIYLVLAKYIHTKLIGASFVGEYGKYIKRILLLSTVFFYHHLQTLILWLWLLFSQPFDALICLKLQNWCDECDGVSGSATIRNYWGLPFKQQLFNFSLNSNWSFLSAAKQQMVWESICQCVWEYECVFVFYSTKRCVN